MNLKFPLHIPTTESHELTLHMLFEDFWDSFHHHTTSSPTLHDMRLSRTMSVPQSMPQMCYSPASTEQFNSAYPNLIGVRDDNGNDDDAKTSLGNDDEKTLLGSDDERTLLGGDDETTSC